MSKVFIVYGGDDYEGCFSVKAFVKEEDAKTFQHRCAAYQLTRPDYLRHKFTESEMNEWQNRMDYWNKHHPGGDSSQHADYFGVEELELI